MSLFFVPGIPNVTNISFPLLGKDAYSNQVQVSLIPKYNEMEQNLESILYLILSKPWCTCLICCCVTCAWMLHVLAVAFGYPPVGNCSASWLQLCFFLKSVFSLTFVAVRTVLSLSVKNLSVLCTYISGCGRRWRGGALRYSQVWEEESFCQIVLIGFLQR